MHKKVLIFILMALLIMSLTSCKKDEVAGEAILNQELLKLLPTEGFQWAYIGPSEYYHEMTLDTIISDASEATYHVTGEVEDVSEGEVTKNYDIDLYYQVNSNSIVQIKTAEMMLDSEYDQITLIKTPLELETSWTEEVKDNNGKKQTIEAEIIEITENDEGTIYKVIYKNKRTGYSESRKIMEGLGVIAFTKAVEIAGDKHQYGYGLYGKNSGYIVSEDKGSDDSEDPTDAEETNTDEETANNPSDDAEEPGDNTAEPEEPTDDPVDTVNEEVAVKNTITAFNDAWIRYVNENDQSFFNYVTTNGVAYQNAKNFKRTGLTEEFLQMDVNQVIVNGNTATAKVYEEIKKTKDGDVTIAKYNWLYDLVKRDGEWLVNGYKKQ